MPGRTKYVPVFSSQLSYSQNGALKPEQTPVPATPPTRSQRDRPRTKLANAGPLKIKLPLHKLHLPKSRKGVKKPDKTPEDWPAEPVADTSVCREEAASSVNKGVGPEAGNTGENLNDKKKAKLEVLGTISKLLKENQLIRQRLVELNNSSGCWI